MSELKCYYLAYVWRFLFNFIQLYWIGHVLDYPNGNLSYWRTRVDQLFVLDFLASVKKFLRIQQWLCLIGLKSFSNHSSQNSPFIFTRYFDYLWRWFQANKQTIFRVYIKMLLLKKWSFILVKHPMILWPDLALSWRRTRLKIFIFWWMLLVSMMHSSMVITFQGILHILFMLRLNLFYFGFEIYYFDDN